MTDCNPIELLISKLEHIKPKGHGKWVAHCPAHDDHSPSLNIKETDDGTILLKCWAGCSALDVVQAVGLELKNLFPVQIAHRHKRTPYQHRQNTEYKALLKRLCTDLIIVVLAGSDVINGTFTQSDMPQLTEATNRLRKVLETANA